MNDASMRVVITCHQLAGFGSDKFRSGSLVYGHGARQLMMRVRSAQDESASGMKIELVLLWWKRSREMNIVLMAASFWRRVRRMVFIDTYLVVL